MPASDLQLPPQPHSARAWLPTGAYPVHAVAAACRLLAAWIERVRQRRALATLDDGMLRDIGVTRVETARECEKPFWR